MRNASTPDCAPFTSFQVLGASMIRKARRLAQKALAGPQKLDMSVADVSGGRTMRLKMSTSLSTLRNASSYSFCVGAPPSIPATPPPWNAPAPPPPRL